MALSERGSVRLLVLLAAVTVGAVAWVISYTGIHFATSPDPRPDASQLQAASMSMELNADDGLQPPGPAESTTLEGDEFGVYDTMIVRNVDGGGYQVELRHRSGPAARTVPVQRFICVGDGTVATYVLDVGSDGEANGTLEVIRCRRAEFVKSTTKGSDGRRTAIPIT